FVGHGHCCLGDASVILLGFKFNGTSVAGISVTLNEAVDSRKPVCNFRRLPAWCVPVADLLLSSRTAVGADECPRNVPPLGFRVLRCESSTPMMGRAKVSIDPRTYIISKHTSTSRLRHPCQSL